MHKTRSLLMGLLLSALCSTVYAQAPGEPAPTVNLLDEYRQVLQSLERVRVQNDQLQRRIDSRALENSKAVKNAANLSRSKSEIAPLMDDMIGSLDNFIELDLPFLLPERRARLKTLRDQLQSADIGIAEKFRQLLAVYQIENDYGREIGFYTDWLDIDGNRRNVSFLHLGRLVLVYQTADRSETGFYNPLTRQWERLPERYRDVVADGLRIAARQAAPKMLRLPVAAPGIMQ